VHAEPIRRRIVVGPRAHELRRYVGPISWVVLEEMLQRSTGADDHIVTQVSVRTLAATLGLAKDTVARAVRRLRDLAVIDAVQARSESGVFDAGSYRLSIPVACLSVAESPLPVSAPPAARAPSVRASSGQLSLLPEV
jgi:hypothetical protein